MRLIDGDELYQKVVGYNGGAVDKTVAKRLIDQMPTVNHADVVSRKTFEQIKWERDTAVKQLEELGYGLGEKIRTCKTCRYNYLEWHEEPCDSCTSGGESNHWKPTLQPSYTDEQIQKMQELEQAEIEKAFQLGVEDARSEIIRCEECKHGMYDMMCKFYWCHGMAHSANWFCADAERSEDAEIH